MDIFRLFDKDSSGEIALEEMYQAFKKLGKMSDETRAELEAHFKFMDSDGSGERLSRVRGHRHRDSIVQS